MEEDVSRKRIRSRVERATGPSYAALRAFDAIGLTGGLRRAAEMLDVDHAAVSRHLRSLEVHFGVDLVERYSNGARLTAEGEKFHRRISAAVAEISSASEELLGRSDNRRLRVWSAPGIASRWMAHWISEFRGKNPDLDIQVQPTDAAPVFAARQADADVRYIADWEDVEPDTGIKSVALARPYTIAVASPEFLSNHPAMQGARDFLQLPLLHRKSDQPWRTWLEGQGLSDLGVLPGLHLWQAHLTMEAARRGQGIALANVLILGDDLKNGTLVEVECGKPVALGTYYFSTRSDDWETPSLARLRRWLVRAALRYDFS